MKYDWEKEVNRLIGTLQDNLPDKFQIVGVAIENVDTGEGALVEADCIAVELHDVTEADVRRDIMSDAVRQYQRTSEAVFRGVSEIKGER